MNNTFVKIKINEEQIPEIENLSQIFSTFCSSFIHRAIDVRLQKYRRSIERPVRKTKEIQTFHIKRSGIGSIMQTLEDYGIPAKRTKTSDPRYCIVQAFVSDEDFEYVRTIADNHDSDDEPSYPMYYSRYTGKSDFIQEDPTINDLPYIEIKDWIVDEMNEICKKYSIRFDDFLYVSIQEHINRYARIIEGPFEQTDVETEYRVLSSETENLLRALEYHNISFSYKKEKSKIKVPLSKEDFDYLRKTADYYAPEIPLFPGQKTS